MGGFFLLQSENKWLYYHNMIRLVVKRLKIIIRRALQEAFLSAPNFIQNSLSDWASLYTSYSQTNRLQKSVSEALKEVEKIPHNKRKRVLIDCGFNNGKSLDEFVVQFPDDFLFYGFECQVHLEEEAKALLDRHKNREINLEFSAVADADEKIDVSIAKDAKWGGIYTAISSTVFSDRNVKGHSYFIDTQKCQAIDFSEKLSEIYKRHTNDDGEPPIIVLKMNIEGAEFPALSRVVQKGNIHQISVLTAEFHHGQFSDSRNSAFNHQYEAIRLALEKDRIPVLDWAS